MYAFAVGASLLIAAIIAGGCTSGHVISGVAQLTRGSFVFGLAIFAPGIFKARVLYKRRLASWHSYWDWK